MVHSVIYNGNSDKKSPITSILVLFDLYYNKVINIMYVNKTIDVLFNTSEKKKRYKFF